MFQQFMTIRLTRTIRFFMYLYDCGASVAGFNYPSPECAAKDRAALLDIGGRSVRSSPQRQALAQFCEWRSVPLCSSWSFCERF